jgi:hypothetical protein
MAGHGVSSQDIDRALYAQASFLADVYKTIAQYDTEWQVNAPDAATLSAIGYTDSANQAECLRWEAICHAVRQLFETGSATLDAPVIADIAKLRGIGG